MKQSNNKNSFNLILKEVSIRKSIKEEFNWSKYASFAALVAFGLVGLVSFLFKTYFDNQFDQKRNVVVDYIQKYLDVPKRQDAIKQINLINDRFKIYKHTSQRNFDLIKFYTDFNNKFGEDVYISQIKMQSTNSMIDLEVSLRKNGYEALYDFLKNLNENDIFGEYKIDLIVFNYASPLDNSSVIVKLQVKYN